MRNVPMIYHETEHRIPPYLWNLSDTQFYKDKGSVFSCFACGGGSTMGYKLAGFDVIGCNEIDKKLVDVYVSNHNPKYVFDCDIRDMLKYEALPRELFNLDILDGSPPCTSFSMAGNREKDWGKSKKFREGQKNQTLDDLSFIFVSLAKKLQPKVVVIENVSSLLIGNAKKYANDIYTQLESAGYHVFHKVLNSKNFGIPQSRERVFFIGIRNDIAAPLLSYETNIFGSIEMPITCNDSIIPFKNIRIDAGTTISPPLTDLAISLWEKTLPGRSFSDAHENGSWFNEIKAHPDKPLPTIRASGLPYDYIAPRKIYLEELLQAFSFPQDYNFLNLSANYVCGMSVPPLIIKNLALTLHSHVLAAKRIDSELQQTNIFRERTCI